MSFHSNMCSRVGGSPESKATFSRTLGSRFRGSTGGRKQ
jgi:hypothetical protein